MSVIGSSLPPPTAGPAPTHIAYAGRVGRVKRRSTGEQVASHIRLLIYSGELGPGDRLRQDDIARELGVSRIPVREAIIGLDREGWVTIEPHRGAFVNGLDRDGVEDHFRLYEVLFGLTVRRVVERADGDGRAEVAAAAAAVVAARGPDAFNTANNRLLATLSEVAGSARLTSMVKVLTNVVPGNFFAQVPGSMEVHRAGVASVAEAMAAGDADRAEAAFAELIGAHADNVIALFERRGSFARAAVDRPGGN